MEIQTKTEKRFPNRMSRLHRPDGESSSSLLTEDVLVAVTMATPSHQLGGVVAGVAKAFPLRLLCRVSSHTTGADSDADAAAAAGSLRPGAARTRPLRPPPGAKVTELSRCDILAAIAR